MNRHDEDAGLDSLATLFTHHVVVPAAVITMVASLLFYLVDVRSAFLGGGPSLKWIGFCFAVATVLIERYRYQGVMGDADLQGCYTAALLGATVLVMLVAPWEERSVSAGERLANLLIIAAVWRFATGVTRGLSPEADLPSRPGLRLYGLERLRVEASRQQREQETGQSGLFRQFLGREKPRSVPPNPSVAVARLAGLALLAFALGEPVLLNAAPQTGVRAQAAVVIFLFATGVVLAAGSALDTLRRAERAGAHVVAGVVPKRLALAGALLMVVLIASLAMPGVHFQGSGRLRPLTAKGEGEEKDRGYQTSDKIEKLGQRPPQESGSQDGSQGRQTNPRSEGRSSQAAAVLGGPAAALLNLLGMLAKWLIVPLVLVLIAGGVWALLRLWPHLGGWWGRLTDRLRALLARLAGLFNRTPRKAQEAAGTDPLADLEDLDTLPPREAVLAAYQRFLALLNFLGHPRPERTTPYELLQLLPRHLRRLEDPARSLTDLYVQAAYAAEPVEHGAREQAILSLRGMKGLLAAMETPGG
ncbi:MAG TPA: DUF4129 domain-containing protein [Thermoanaerobaculia bacterium]|nr:DUF4129 domain-containing protein [Thermoanaerobaculia bacterium]